jgi:hypothetical protein
MVGQMEMRRRHPSVVKCVFLNAFIAHRQGRRGSFQTCQVCFWENEGQDGHDAAVVRGGPNGLLSLTQARAN